MKKITLITAFLVAFGMNAQIFSDDFEDEDISDWFQIDADGDGQEFFSYFPTGNPSATMASASYTATTGALTPDNYSVSQAIDVTGASGLMLSYMVGGQDPDWSAENYTVYVSTGNTIADFQNPANTVSYTENLGDDPNAAGALVNRTLDASSLDGATTVYIAFRHHDVTDQFYIHFDDVQLDGTLSTVDSNINGFNYFYSPQTKNFTISANDAFNNISIFNILGQAVIAQKLSTTNEVISLASLKDGIYIANVTANGQTTSFKLIKR